MYTKPESSDIAMWLIRHKVLMLWGSLFSKDVSLGMALDPVLL